MISPLRYERASKKNLKGLALAQIAAEKVLFCVMTSASSHELQVVLQGGTEEKDKKYLGIGRGMF